MGDIMSDPWDDADLRKSGVITTSSGLRVPVPVASWPSAAPARARGSKKARAARATDHRGVGPKGYQRSDERIYEQVCDRLLLDPYLDASEITVSVAKGKVSLKGTVPTERMREAAIVAATTAAGGNVNADLEVTTPSPERGGGRGRGARGGTRRPR
jgi:hypothetical protein